MPPPPSHHSLAIPAPPPNFWVFFLTLSIPCDIVLYICVLSVGPGFHASTMLDPQHLELCPASWAPNKYAWDKTSVEELSVRCNAHPSPTASGPDLQAHNLGAPAEPQDTSRVDSYVSPVLLTPIWWDRAFPSHHRLGPSGETRGSPLGGHADTVNRVFSACHSSALHGRFSESHFIDGNTERLLQAGARGCVSPAGSPHWPHSSTRWGFLGVCLGAGGRQAQRWDRPAFGGSISLPAALFFSKQLSFIISYI